jgi:hypothetical protein
MSARMLAITMVTTACAWSGNPTARPLVRAHIYHVTPHDFIAVNSAKAIATELMAQAGVQLQWVNQVTGPDVIDIEMDERANSSLPSKALAYALPFATGPGTRIHIFRDRITNPSWLRLDTMIAYVMAHEIGHVLQRQDSHAETGVMKAQWDIADYIAMGRGRLSFSEEDREKICLRLDQERSDLALRATSGLR